MVDRATRRAFTLALSWVVFSPTETDHAIGQADGGRRITAALVGTPSSSMETPEHGKDQLSERSEMLGAAALIAREKLLNHKLRFVYEISRRQKMEAELSEIRRRLQFLGFATAMAGDRSS
jgi:hypothetical protein